VPRIGELSYKPYPACRFTHGAIEAATQLRERLGAPSVDEVERIEVRYPALDRFGIVCRPYERRGAQEMDAQFSTAYLVASALLFGEISFASYTEERFADDRIARLAERTTVERVLPPGGEEDLGPIEVELAGVVERVPVVLGSVARPLTDDDRRAKFATCLQRYGVEDDAGPAWERLLHAVDASWSGADGPSDTELRALVREPLTP
jgi:2-methylcitrate dehydratase PrpD